MPDLALLEAVRAGGKRSLAAALSGLEAQHDRPETAALLDQAFASPLGTTIGLTGPPGVGKSSLVDALIRHWRDAGVTVGVIAIDPSSSGSRGALLGDRTRLSMDPADQGLFVRSMAARDRLGGLAEATFPAMVLMRALFDLVLVETVGIGQSETAIAELADLVVLCVQPGAGDALQHMKAGILEVPDLVIVTKADLGQPATRAATELRAALSLGVGGARPVRTCSAATGEGVEGLAGTLRTAAEATAAGAHQRRLDQLIRWTEQQIGARFGLEGVRQLRRHPVDISEKTPFSAFQAVERRLSAAISAAFR